MSSLWRVTFTYDIGRKLAHNSYAVLAETEEEAKAKAVAYVYPNPVEQATYTIEAEVDYDGVMKSTTHYTR